MRSRSTRPSAEAVAAQNIEYNIEDRDDDLQNQRMSMKQYNIAEDTHRDDDGDDDHDDARNGRDDGVDGASNRRNDGSL